MKAVFTFTTIDKREQKTVCHLIESLDIPLSRVLERLRDFESKGFEFIGNITIVFVEEE